MYLHLQAKALYSLLAFLSPWGWHWIISSHHEPPNGQAWLALFREILHHLVYAIIPGTIRSSYFHHLTVDIIPPFFTFYLKILGRNIVDSNKGHTLLGGPKWIMLQSFTTVTSDEIILYALQTAVCLRTHSGETLQHNNTHKKIIRKL